MEKEQALRIVRKAIAEPEQSPKPPKNIRQEFRSWIDFKTVKHLNQISASMIISVIAAMACFENTHAIVDTIIIFLFSFLFVFFISGFTVTLLGWDEREEQRKRKRDEEEMILRNHRMSHQMWEDRYLMPLAKAVDVLQQEEPELGVSLSKTGSIAIVPTATQKIDLLDE